MSVCEDFRLEFYIDKLRTFICEKNLTKNIEETDKVITEIKRRGRVASVIIVLMNKISFNFRKWNIEMGYFCDTPEMYSKRVIDYHKWTETEVDEFIKYANMIYEEYVEYEKEKERKDKEFEDYLKDMNKKIENLESDIKFLKMCRGD